MKSKKPAFQRTFLRVEVAGFEPAAFWSRRASIALFILHLTISATLEVGGLPQFFLYEIATSHQLFHYLDTTFALLPTGFDTTLHQLSYNFKAETQTNVPYISWYALTVTAAKPVTIGIVMCRTPRLKLKCQRLKPRPHPNPRGDVLSSCIWGI